MVLTTPSDKVSCYETLYKGMSDKQKQWAEENGRGYKRQLRFFKNCRAMEEEECDCHHQMKNLVPLRRHNLNAPHI
jgi:hypothetical protein